MKKIVNEMHGEGYLYEHKLEMKHSEKNNTDFISGKVSLATNEDCTNIVDFHFIYVTPVYAKSGKPNPNFKILENIINSGAEKTIMGGSKETALKLRIDGTIGLNDFYSKNEDKVISVVRNEVSFINTATSLNTDENKRNTFKTDILITNTFRKEADEERNIAEHLVVSGATFNDYSKALLPVSYVVYKPEAIGYFEGLDANPQSPVFTKVWGQIASQEFVSKFETKSAFGEDLIEERKTTRKEYVITGAQSDCYDWDTEDSILATEVKKAMGDRELHLAEVKKNYEDYQNTKGNTQPTPKVAAPGGFAF